MDSRRRMRTDEALTHRWLSLDTVMIRRRELVNYPSSRLRKTAILTARHAKENSSPMTHFVQPLI